MLSISSANQWTSLGGFIRLSVGFLVLSFVWALAKVFYNIFLHPLARYPGPKSRGASYVIDAWSRCAGKQLEDEFALHQQYGPVVRVAPDTLSFISGQAWKDIYGMKPNRRQVAKDPMFYGVGGFGGCTISYCDDEPHARMRKLLSHAFAEGALREQEVLATRYFDLFIEQLGRMVDGADQGKVDMVKWFNFVTFDLVGDLAFGRSFDCLQSESYHFWVRNIFKSIHMASIQQMGMRYGIIKYALRAMAAAFPSIGRARKDHLDFTIGRVEKRLALKDNDRRDFMHYILRNNGKGGMSHDEIVANSNTLLIAGSETVATLLCGALYSLMKNPEAYEKVKAEVRGHFKSDGEINMTSTGHLRYLAAVIEESLRCYPPVPNRLPRRTGPEGELIDGHFVPPNTSVAVAPFAAYHDESNFHDPFKFAPERWLSDDQRPVEYANDHRDALQPFSYGPRNCLGKNLAYIESRSILARFLWHFNCELLPESDGWAEKQKTYIIWEKAPMMVKLARRTATA